MGISETSNEQVAFNTKMITSTDWVSYPIMRFMNLPRSTSSLINRPTPSARTTARRGLERDSSVAITAAFFDATGKTARTLPLRRPT